MAAGPSGIVGEPQVSCLRNGLRQRVWSDVQLEPQSRGGGDGDPLVAEGIRMETIAAPERGMSDVVGIDVKHRRAVGRRNPPESVIEGPDATLHPRAGHGDDGGRVRIGHHQHRSAGAAKCLDHRLEVGADAFEVDVTSEDVIEAADHARKIGLERQRGLELLGADLGHLAPADRQIGVAEVRVLGAESLRQPVGPAAVGPVRIGIVEALGGRIAEGDVSREAWIHNRSLAGSR